MIYLTMNYDVVLMICTNYYLGNQIFNWGPKKHRIVTIKFHESEKSMKPSIRLLSISRILKSYAHSWFKLNDIN